MPALRERCFGDWEGSATVNYERVWAADAAGEGQCAGGVESTASVLDRATRLVADLEWKYSGLDILLVSHGDTLQILQAGFLSLDPSGHRRLPHLATGEMRLQSLRSELDHIQIGTCRAGDHVVDAAIR